MDTIGKVDASASLAVDVGNRAESNRSSVPDPAHPVNTGSVTNDPQSRTSSRAEARKDTPETTIGPEPARNKVRNQVEATPARRARADEEAYRQGADSIQERLDDLGNHRIRISYDDESSRFVLKIIDSQTKEEIGQIPADQVLEANRRLDHVRGLIFDEKS